MHLDLVAHGKTQLFNCCFLEISYNILVGQIEIYKLIFVSKNWLSNPHVGCLKCFDFAFICELNLDLIKELDVEFENKMKCEKFPHTFVT
jgi:hypothetical protein